jgi:hypothetical protein
MDEPDQSNGRTDPVCRMGRFFAFTTHRAGAQRPWRVTTRINRPCFRSERGPTMSEPEMNVDLRIRDEVRRIWGEWIGLDPDLPEAVREEQIEREAARLTQLVEETVGDSAHGFLMDRWRAENPGVTPDYPTTVALMTTAWHSARSKILEEHLYPQVTEEIYQRVISTDAVIEEERRAHLQSAQDKGDEMRWTTLSVDISPLASRIVDRVWMDRPGRFLLLAQALIQQRLDGNQPTPTTATDPIAAELETLILDEMDRTPGATPF